MRWLLVFPIAAIVVASVSDVRTPHVQHVGGPEVTESPQATYRAEEVTYENREAGVELSGTLTLPDSPGAYPAVILLSGSGPNDRDASYDGHKPFRVLAEYLTPLGIAVLRYDERGVGASTGDFPTAFEDFAADALAGVAYLKSRPEIDAGKIGLIGWSEGATHAPLAANRTSDVAFLVLLAPGCLSVAELIPLQTETFLLTEGASAEFAAMQRARVAHMIAALVDAENDSIAAQTLNAMIEEHGAADDAPEGVIRELASGSISRLRVFLDPEMRRLLSFDPGEVLRQVTVPVLGITGEKDTQVPPKQELPLVEEAFRQGGNTDYTVLELPGLNHLFQPAETGAPSGYSKASVTFAPAALEVIGDWILERTRG